MLELYEKSRDVIIDVIENLKQDKSLIFPVRMSSTEIGVDYLDDVAEALRDGKFHVSVCGQIKAGKSTLLNALLFEEELLPVDVTPETSTLTKISHGNEFKACITFYDADEWSKLNSRDEFREYHADELVKMKDEGIDPCDYLGTTAVETDQSALQNFIGAQGDLTLLVKQVEIEHPRVPHDGLVFIDTPGLNDPNIVRSEITIDWVGKSDAVLFVLHSKGVDEDDYSFIDDSLAGIREECFILVLNRCDELSKEGLNRVIEYINKSFTTGNIASKNLITDNSCVIPVSALAAYLARADRDTLSERDLWHMNRIESGNPGLIQSNGRFSSLEKAISEKLVDNKGKKLLRSNATKIKVLLDTKNRHLQMEMERINTQLENLGKDYGEIETQLKELSISKKELNDSMIQIQGKLKDGATKASNSIFKMLDKKFKAIAEDIKRDIETAENPDTFARQLPWVLKNMIDDSLIHGAELERTIDRICLDLDEELTAARTILASKLKRDFPGFMKFISFRLDLPGLSVTISESLSQSVYESFRNCIARVLGFLWVRKSTTRNKLDSALIHLIPEIDKNVKGHLNAEVFDKYDSIQADVALELDSFINRIQDDLKRIIDEKKNTEEVKTEYQSKLEQLEKDIDNLERIQDNTYEVLNNLLAQL